ncbi:MAG: ABC transporter permease, partial [Anaerotignaceae bacterium]
MSRWKKITSKRWLPMLIWIIGMILLWEISATVVEATKRTPENVLPHLYQIIGQIFSTKPVSSGKTATMIVLGSASKTLFR